MAYRFGLVCLQLIELPVYLVELRSIGCMREKSAGYRGHIFQGIQVKGVFTSRARVADCDGMNHDTFVFGNLRSFGRRYFAGSVIAVGERDQHAFFHLTAIEHCDGKPEGIAESGLGTSHFYLSLVQQLAAHFQVLCEWRLDKGRAAKKDQAYSIAFPFREKIVEHFLYCREPV